VWSARGVGSETVSSKNLCSPVVEIMGLPSSNCCLHSLTVWGSRVESIEEDELT